MFGLFLVNHPPTQAKYDKDIFIAGLAPTDQLLLQAVVVHMVLKVRSCVCTCMVRDYVLDVPVYQLITVQV